MLQCFSTCGRPWVSSLAVCACTHTIITSKINYSTFDIYHNMAELEGLILGETRQAYRVVKNNRDNVGWWPGTEVTGDGISWLTVQSFNSVR